MEEEIKNEETEKIIEKRTEKLKIKFLNWLKDPYNKAFLGIFLLAIILRIYFLWVTLGQAVWWDAADYLTEAKVFAGILKITYYFTPRRTFLMPLLWALLLKFGFGEFSFRILELLFSILAIPAIYLLGKEVFDKKIALISSFLLSVFWMHLFYSNRLMTETPTLTLLLFSIYFFWKGYTNKNNEKAFIWFGVFLGLAFLARAGTLVMFAVFPLFLVITERFKFLKKKYLWFGGLCVLLLMGSFFIFTSYKQNLNAVSYFLALTPETSEGQPRFSNMLGIAGISEYAKAMPHYFAQNYLLMLLFVFGFLLLFFNLIMGFDIMITKKNIEVEKYLFIFLLALVPFLFQAIMYNHFEDRYIMNAFPAFFIMMSLGLVQIGKWTKHYSKYLAIFLIVILLIFGAYSQIKYANTIILSKKDSYKEVKEAGEWIKENSQPSDIIFSASVPQHTYYAERETYNFVYEQVNETYFEEKVKELKPTFLVLSIFEPHAEWAYSYPQKHPELLIPVKSYTQNNQPVLVIYKFNYPFLGANNLSIAL